MTPTSPRGKRASNVPGHRITQTAAAVSLLLGGMGHVWAQEAAAKPEAEQVVVTGIRKSLDTSLNLKREARGVVDGIVAEDIGKFPDANLAEAAQRISGVSIDRSAGEGSKITVRGVGPDYNLVLLNGRQMPAANLNETSASNSRSFDFANLAAEGISAMEVYKTSRSENPAGGLGAVINIKTNRPLDAKNRIATVGVKLVSDESNQRLPGLLQGEQLTPELSGLYSNVFADGTFGISLFGSYQKRNSGYNQAGVSSGWHTFKGDEVNWGTIPLPGAAGSENITNRPKASDLYVIPQELRYSLNGIERTRTNGQLVLQYRPFKDLTATLDHTYSENKVHTKRSELSAWFNFGPSSSSWTDGPIATPNTYTETYSSPADVAMAGAMYGTKNKNDSTGLNVAWKVSDKLKLELDGHHSVAEAGADSPYGTSVSLGVSMYNRASNTADFTHPFPVLSIGLSGDPAAGPSLMQVTGSTFRNGYMRNAIDQAQLKGKYNLSEASELDFGVGFTNVNNRTAFANVQQDDWGGHKSPSAYADNLWQPANLVPYFSRSFSASGANTAAQFNNFYVWDFNAVRNAAIAADGSDKWFTPSYNFTDDRRTQEKSSSAYVQYLTDWEVAGIPMNAAVGLRYESTKVTSQALVPAVTGIQWVSANEFALVRGAPTFTALSGSYSYLLPSIDWQADLSSKLKLRASYGETIGRPGWDAIQGGQTLNDFRVSGGSGSQGNPNLKPLLSKNFDLSAEYYYAKSSYAAVGLFRKNISDFIGSEVVQASPFNLTTPIGGAMYNAAVANSCTTKDAMCIRNYIFANYNGSNGVVKTGVAGNGDSLGTIAGQAGDPAAVFNISTPANQRNDHINGIELNVQHAFGNSGFGGAANYTWVRSGLKFDNANLSQQYALPGMSNAANLVGYYENDVYSVRLAYNWRGEFLAGTTSDVFGSPGPAYVDSYGQIDLSAGYKYNKNLSFQFEAINLNDGIQRVHGRTKQETLFYTQTGRRYAIAGRYTF